MSVLGQIESEPAKTIKSFKGSQELENFYRFLFENGLRHEAKTALELVVKQMTPKKKPRGRKPKKAKTLQ